MMKEAEHLDQKTSERLVTKEDLRRVLMNKTPASRPRRATRTDKKIKIEDIQKIENAIVMDRRRLYTQATSDRITAEIAASFLFPMYLLGMRPSEATDFDILTPSSELGSDQLEEAYRDIEQAEKKVGSLTSTSLAILPLYGEKFCMKPPSARTPSL